MKALYVIVDIVCTLSMLAAVSAWSAFWVWALVRWMYE